ncbi:MAG TPA: hypothetical protein VND92_09450 [Vicinamibacterales bacterium]|nr:hypothetical protein [Vicinamibacterales bacterium]
MPSVLRRVRYVPALIGLLALAALIAALMPRPLAAQAGVNPSLYAGMRWRLVGPFRAGRAVAATGVPGQPDVYYFGAVAGGVWKTENAGLTWQPIFDSEPIASIGAVAVAPSNPDIVYVGSGEADMRSAISYGDGMYKSTDAGRTWTHIGLTDTRQIGQVLVDPHNPDIVFVAALGHAYGPNDERGVFRTTDGGRTWKKILFKNADTGAIDLAFDPRDAKTIYAALWQTRRPPWNVYPPSNGPGSGLYKSTDRGDTWQPLTNGLPTAGLGRIGIAVAPSRPDRVYLVVDAKKGGLYRSDDAGAHWTLIDNESRIWGRGWYFCGVTVDPKDPDTVYVANTALYRSHDGGHRFTPIKGSPGGDDYHSLWINPDDPHRMVLSSDQGVVVSVDGAKTWSSWYNQPTAQFYHVSADHRFPYWLYGAQQDSGAMAVPSRSNYSRTSAHDWHPISVGGENGYIVPDPTNPEILYGGDSITRYNQVTGADRSISPTIGLAGSFRQTWTLPVAVSPIAPHALYFSHQMLFRTVNGGHSWEQISPDLTRVNPGVPPNLDPATAADANSPDPRRGVIYAIAPSPVDAATIWVGTDDGLIHVTHDRGKTWKDVTPKPLTPWSKIGIIDASPFDVNTAYAAVDRHRLEDYKPYIYRTHDGGRTWQNVVNGIPGDDYVNVVREDPVRKGLLYAGTEKSIYVSFDDGGRWEPLQLNLPHTSIRDLAFRDGDLVAATFGRSLWILDDLTPLRQLNATVASAPAHLFRPAVALRIQPPSDEGTPFTHETPTGENPPQGAIIDYTLQAASSSPVTLAIRDQAGKVVRRFSSADTPQAANVRTLTVELAWMTPPPTLSAAAGMHRFVWDLRYAAPPSLSGAAGGYFPMQGPLALPGSYTVTLTADGQQYSAPLTVRMDPRVKTPSAALAQQFQVAHQSYEALQQIARVFGEATALEARLRSSSGHAAAAAELAQLIGAPAGDNPPSATGGPVTTLRALYAEFSRLEQSVESGPAAPTVEEALALARNRATLAGLVQKWNRLKAQAG